MLAGFLPAEDEKSGADLKEWEKEQFIVMGGIYCRCSEVFAVEGPIALTKSSRAPDEKIKMEHSKM